MAQVLIRNLEDGTVDRLKSLAKAHHRSLESEVRTILEAAAERPSLVWEPARRRLAALHKRLSGRRMTRTIDLLREDRR